MPRALVRAAAQDATAGAARRDWMNALPSAVEDLARRWSLDVERPFQPGGVASWVAPARGSGGRRMVLKLGWRHDEAMHEADGLKTWDGRGTVRLLDALVTADTNALLLEACEPGGPLSQALPAHEQDVIVAGLLRRLWIQPPGGHLFRPLQSMCDLWADEFAERYPAAATPGLRLDPGLVSSGIELWRLLPATGDRAVLLFTDLHPGNVLAAERESWLAIDPKPYLGDPTYDPLQHMLNFPARLASDPVGFVRRMAGLLELDSERLRQWLFARCIQESLTAPNLYSTAVALAP